MCARAFSRLSRGLAELVRGQRPCLREGTSRFVSYRLWKARGRRVWTSEGRRNTGCCRSASEGGRRGACMQRGVCDRPPSVILQKLKRSQWCYGSLSRAHGWRRGFGLKGTAGGASIGRFSHPPGACRGCVAVCGRRGHGSRNGGARGAGEQRGAVSKYR